ncbi:MAG: hypothetical protein QXG91_00180 [Candidatus Aenigmatarchaeota archaeon]
MEEEISKKKKYRRDLIEKILTPLLYVTPLSFFPDWGKRKFKYFDPQLATIIGSSFYSSLGFLLSLNKYNVEHVIVFQSTKYSSYYVGKIIISRELLNYLGYYLVLDCWRLIGAIFNKIYPTTFLSLSKVFSKLEEFILRKITPYEKEVKEFLEEQKSIERARRELDEKLEYFEKRRKDALEKYLRKYESK